MSVAACFWWIDRMAAAIGRAPGWMMDAGQRIGLGPQQHGAAVAWLAAAESVGNWPHNFTAFLDDFQQIDKQMTTATGVGRRFGTLLRHAAKLEELGYPAPAVALRSYLVEHYAGGHLNGKVCLFQRSKDRAVLRQRAWISQTSAAKMLGLRHGAVARLVQEGILKGQLHMAGQRGRSVGLVHRDSVELLQRELRDALSVKAAAKRLSIGRHGVLDLIHGGSLPRAVRTAKGWQIPSASVADLESLCEQLPVRKSAPLQWLSLRQATRLFGPTGLTLTLLIELVRTEKVSAGMADFPKLLNGIVVSRADLTAQVPEIRSRRAQTYGYPVHHLGKILFPGRPIKSSVLAKWISAKLLKARKSGRARIVSIEEVQRFRSRYCLADEACRLLDITRSTLSHWEAEGLVQPVYGKRVTPGAGFSLYRREDLTGLSRRRSRAA
jgi:plasmid maintenance system antidote protein VapI